MYKSIKKIAVLGSGQMGSAIACHMANAGLDVLLLDIPAPGLNESDMKNTALKKKLVNDNLKACIKSKPDPLYIKELAKNIETGNFKDDLNKLSTCDWIIEVIIEDPQIKGELYKRVEQFRKPGTPISTNTSGIPVDFLAKEQSEDFRQCFFGSHFFNPPRYLQLLELIPGTETKKELIAFIMQFAHDNLGKKTVLCKDTPAFIANRIGIFSITKILELTEKYKLDIETIDALTGISLARPKSGTFRLQDLIGIDVGAKVLDSVTKNCPNDEYLASKANTETPKYLKYLLDNNFYGNKSGQGFYKKTNDFDPSGRRVILSLDLEALEYRTFNKPQLESIRSAKKIENPEKRIQSFFSSDDKDQGKDFIINYLLTLFAYVSFRIPEITEHIYSIDDAMKAGYGWEFGPFETWDLIGLENVKDLASKANITIAPWVNTMIEKGFNRFYTRKENKLYVYDPAQSEYKLVPGSDKIIYLKTLKDKILFENAEAKLLDIGDGVLCVEFTSKNNVLGEGTGNAIHKGLDLCEQEKWNGLLIGNNSPNFTVGANLMLVAMLSYQKEWEKLEQMVLAFQQMNMRLRYSRIPVFTATKGYVFGGGIEMSMHADGVVAAAESYIGLVEAGVGIIPAGGGTKEFALRLSESFYDGDVMIPKLIDKFKTIAMAEVATSASMAFELGYLQKGRDVVLMNQEELLFKGKEAILNKAKAYLPPSNKKINVLGRQGLATLKAAINEFKLGGFISDHDAKIAEKTAHVICGGDLTQMQEVSEDYLLDLEREAFISLCGEEKTLARIQYMLQFNKPLRN